MASPAAWPSKLTEDDPRVWLDIFALRRDDYALQGRDGKFYRAKQPLTKAIVRRHLEGSHTVGPYVLRGTECLYAVVDSDYPGGLTDIQRLGFKLQQMGLAPALELSRFPRGHLWVLSNSPVRAIIMRRLIIGATRELGLPIKTANYAGLEIFPKQDSTMGYGNLIRGPLGIHRKTGFRYPLADVLTLTPLEPFTVSGQLKLWGAWPKSSPEVFEAAAQRFPDHRPPRVERAGRAPANTNRLDILYWADQLTRMRQKGSTYAGLCPFHSESDPSFYVYPTGDHPRFYCFGCGAWGDAADLKARATGHQLSNVLREVAAGA